MSTWAERRRYAARVEQGLPAAAARPPAAPVQRPRADAGAVSGRLLAKSPEMARRLSRAVRGVAAKEGPEAALALLLDGLDLHAGVSRSRPSRTEVRG